MANIFMANYPCMDMLPCVHPFIHHLTFRFSTPCPLWTMLQWVWGCRYLFQTLISIVLDKYSAVELLDHIVILLLIFLRKFHFVLHNSCIILHLYQQCTRFPISPLPHQHSLISFFFLIMTLLKGVRCLIVVLICIFLISDAEQLFIHMLIISMSSLEKCPFVFSAHFGLFATE